MKKKTETLTLKMIETLVSKAREHRIEPVRYASTDVIEIKTGTFKGFMYIKKGAKPRINGKYSFFGITYHNKKPTIFVHLTKK